MDYYETFKYNKFTTPKNEKSVNFELVCPDELYNCNNESSDTFNFGDNSSDFNSIAGYENLIVKYYGPSDSFTDMGVPVPAQMAQLGIRLSAVKQELEDSSLVPCDQYYGYTEKEKPLKVLAGRYLLGDTIGRGSYGKVKDCIDLSSLRRCAVKITSKIGVRKIPGGWNQALTEASILRRLPPCRNIVGLNATLHLASPERIVLVMEQCLGSVHDLQAAGFPSLPDAPISTGSVCQIPPPSLTTLDEYSRGDMESLGAHYLVSTAPSALGRRANLASPGPTKILSSRTEATTLQQQFRRLSEAQAHAYFLQLIDGVDFLHQHGIIHRDIKPANLLLTPSPGCGLEAGNLGAHEIAAWCGQAENGELSVGRRDAEVVALSRGFLVKLADFGVSAAIHAFAPNRRVGGGQTTPAVQSPEVARGVDSHFDGPRLDIYSIGVSLFFMLTGHVPFNCANVLQIFDAIVTGLYSIPDHVSHSATNLIRGMMANTPRKRLSLKEVRQHSWVEETPIQPPSLRESVQICAANWKSSSRSAGGPCGVACWLDPFEYLRRPLTKYPSPHIDETGARLFSPAEIEAISRSPSAPSLGASDLLTQSRAAFNLDEAEVPALFLPPLPHLHLTETRFSDQVAPLSTWSALKAYTGWPQASSAPYRQLMADDPSGVPGSSLIDGFASLNLASEGVRREQGFRAKVQRQLSLPVRYRDHPDGRTVRLPSNSDCGFITTPQPRIPATAFGSLRTDSVSHPILGHISAYQLSRLSSQRHFDATHQADDQVDSDSPLCCPTQAPADGYPMRAPPVARKSARRLTRWFSHSVEAFRRRLVTLVQKRALPSSTVGSATCTHENRRRLPFLSTGSRK